MVDRRALRFAEAVADNFGFLLTYGFQQIQSEPTIVRFESDRILVNIYHGRQSFELGLEVGPRQGDPFTTKPFSMSEVNRLFEPETADRYRNYAAHNTKEVEEGIRLLAKLFRRHVDGGPLNHAGLFGLLEMQRETWKADLRIA